MTDLDSRNDFYLGREHDLATGETNADAPVMYSSKDLTTHAVCVGMTGSGKTGLCLSLIEEALLDGVPVIAIDPKGDLGNLLLAFPNLEPDDFKKWVDESAATRQGLSRDELAEKTATLWRNGLAKWGQGPERIQQYNDSCERLIFTPGSSSGIPLTVLKSFAAPPPELREDYEALAERISSAVSGLLALLGIDADPVQSEEHIFLSNIFKHAWAEGRDLGIAELIAEIQQPPFDKVGVLGVEQFFPAKKRTKLAMELNNLLASPTFAGWMKGQALDVDQLLHAPPDAQGRRKPRLSIISIAHLDDSQRMFFVTILLNEVLAWMRTQPGTSSLRAILYMDEVFGYFPPVASPPSKQPMLTLLKQARAFGVGVVLATQNPVDLDYKGLSNCGTWLLGRLQTERDKARVIEGLEGASAQAGSAFDKQKMEATLAALGSRVFLINNVHEDAPKVFHTRWAMSYLAGPLARDKIEELMDPVRAKYVPPPQPDKPKPEKPKPEPKPAEEADHAESKDEPAAARDKPPAEAASLTASLQAVKQREGELFWGIVGIPLVFVNVIYRIVDLLWAQMNKGATKRRTSSVFSAWGKTTPQLSKIGKARGEWSEAYLEHQGLKGAPAKCPLLPASAWIAVAGNLLLLALLIGLVVYLLPRFFSIETGG